MHAQPLPPSRVTWATFRRGDPVCVCDPRTEVPPALAVVDDQGEWVQTEDGRRWQQGTGQLVVCVLQGQAQVDATTWIVPASPQPSVDPGVARAA